MRAGVQEACNARALHAKDEKTVPTEVGKNVGAKGGGHKDCSALAEEDDFCKRLWKSF